MRNVFKKIKKCFKELRIKREKKDSSAEITALSPNDKLFNNPNPSDYLKYESFLKSAFTNRRVRNIAITGNHGVGKSSIIRSYESNDKKRGKGYLYISLMDFNNNRGTDYLHVDATEAISSEEKNQLQQEFEHYLLCQILSKVDSQSLPHSTFRLIPRRKRKTNFLISALTSVIIICGFGILFKTPLGISTALIKAIYYVCGGAVAVLSFLASLLLTKSITSAKISANYKGIKIETEAEKTTESYIDAHLFEIVYALETLAGDIGYTVVLEDMDRLGRSICVDIFSKLRRVNYLVNDRNKLRNKYIRFIYAFDDSVFELTKNTKFFDYVMSVTPKLNYNTAGNYFKNLILSSTHRYGNRQDGIQKIIETYDEAFWQKAGAVIHDYRTLNHISNEFQLFADIMLSRELMPNQKWLPFVIYKNVLAEDYCCAFEEKGILELDNQQRNNRIVSLCSKKGDTYVALVQDLFDYLIQKIHLNSKDFQEFTGLPNKIIEIRDEMSEQSFFKKFLNKKVLPDYKVIGEYVDGKTVLITGGAGSIGSELSRQLAEYNIKNLVIVDISENACYDIQQELLRRMAEKRFGLYIEIASIRDKNKMNELFMKYKPNVVFHAAAHKHVPLMERNPEEAIKNNILGTYNLVLAAEASKVERFILISTDKAVNPTNIMGASKRFCELLIRSRRNSQTVFSAVRFGNVLSSNGSVIPLFKRQIENGGPITITDKRLIRYFMTIPEASQLILQSCVMADSSQIFVFDMGKPVKIVSLAESMIRLSGLIPYKDIDIVEVGLRPGEKLYEEQLINVDALIATENKMIYIEQDELPVDFDRMESVIIELNNAIEQHYDSSVLVNLVKEIVPMYTTHIERENYASVG